MCLCWGVCVHLSVYVSGVCVCICMCVSVVSVCMLVGLSTQGFEGHNLEMRGG